jgi:hypothetical protein
VVIYCPIVDKKYHPESIEPVRPGKESDPFQLVRPTQPNHENGLFFAKCSSGKGPRPTENNSPEDVMNILRQTKKMSGQRPYHSHTGPR